MRDTRRGLLVLAALCIAGWLMTASTTAQPKPNILVIMGDDIGIWNIGAYHRGMMAGRTPNLDKIAAEGMLFTDYYAEASCTAGRANFITGELPIRTGMTTVGQAGAPTGLPAEASTIATALKAQGYATGQFGKNHLGDRNEFLPTVHGFDEFFGYLYHLDAMEDPAHPGYPQELLDKVGPDENTIVVFTTDNGTEVFSWPDGGITPFAQSKGTVMEGGFRVPCIARWPGHIPADTVQNGLFSGLDWFPTFLAAAGNTTITNDLLKGVKIGDRTYKNHLDGYNQMDLITGKGPSARHEIFYFGESTLGAVRIDDFKYRFIDQPKGWLGEKTHADVPFLTNLRLDPFERTGWPENGTKDGAQNYFTWFQYEFWRFVFVQQQVQKLAMTAIDFPPMQKGASFNLDSVKAKIAAARAAIAK